MKKLPAAFVLLLLVPCFSLPVLRADDAGDDDGKEEKKFALSSSAFKDKEMIPRKYTGEGDDISPPLAWKHVPEGTKQFVLVMEDADSPTREPWVHWVMYRIDADVTSLKAERPNAKEIDEPKGARQGRNSWGILGYRGPMPPKGDDPHHYVFTLYALDTEVELKGGATKHMLMSAIKEHVLETTTLTGRYVRE